MYVVYSYLVIQHTKSMCRIILSLSVACLFPIFFTDFRINGKIFGKEIIEEVISILILPEVF